MLQRITVLQEEFIHFQLLEQLLPAGEMMQGLQCHLPWLTLGDSPPSIISATFSSPEPKNLSKAKCLVELMPLTGTLAVFLGSSFYISEISNHRSEI